MPKLMVSISKYLSLLLRHEPETIGLTLDAHGWASIDELLRRAADHGTFISREALDRVVAENDKQRQMTSAAPNRSTCHID